MTAVDYLVEQLWRPAMEGGDVRVHAGRPGHRPEAGWQTAEAYWLFPNARHTELVLPRGPRRITAAAAVNYRGMRRPVKNLTRAALGGLAMSGAPLSPDSVLVQTRAARDGSSPVLPLAAIREALELPVLYAATGVRTGANRKATLQLLDAEGRPAGFAKVGWNDVTDAFVRTEADALRAVARVPGAMRAPAVLAEVDYCGHPIVVTEPLPQDLRGARNPAVGPPTSEELFALCPVVRHARVAETAHFESLLRRLERLGGRPDSAATATHALALGRRLEMLASTVPVTSRWHGDLTPWNRARDDSGQLWVWDWESSEPDAVAGLDALHWAMSTRRTPTNSRVEIDLPGCLADAEPHLQAAGVHVEDRAAVAAVYALTVAERAADLADRSQGWETLWISPAAIGELLDQASAMLTAASAAAATNG